jgi:O-methyltransferase
MSLKQLIKRVLAPEMYERRLRRDRTIGNKRYTNVFPEASYAPWLSDSEFQLWYGKIAPNTLVDQYRCFELWELVAQMGSLQGDLIEVGVWRGGTGALIARRAQQLPGNRKVYLCDTFSGVVKVSSHDSTYLGGEHADTSENHVRQFLSQLGIDNTVILRGIFPDAHIEAVLDRTFCFVHIDVDVYQSAKEVFDFVWPLIPRGGVVVFDDYGFETCDGIPKLVAEYRFQPGKLVIHNLNGHAVIIKTA